MARCAHALGRYPVTNASFEGDARALFRAYKRAPELAVDEIARRSPRYKCKPVISCGFGLIWRGAGWLDAMPMASRKLVARPR